MRDTHHRRARSRGSARHDTRYATAPWIGDVGSAQILCNFFWIWPAGSTLAALLVGFPIEMLHIIKIPLPNPVRQTLVDSFGAFAKILFEFRAQRVIQAIEIVVASQ